MLGELANAHQVIRHLGPLADAEALAAEIAEPLRTSAPIAYRIAGETCVAGSPANDCRAYHAIWQYLRLADVIRSVRSDGALFVATAARRARQGNLRRVLICGTADYSMLAYLDHASRQARAATQFDVLDRCATTLHLNDWFGRQRDFSARTIEADVFVFEPDQPYDLICAHSFLAWMDYEDRPRLMKRWHDWLVPGGEACFSNRVDPEGGQGPDHKFASRQRAMSEEFFARCAELKIELPSDHESFAQLIERYSRRTLFRRHDMPLSILRGWLESAGLNLDLQVPVATVVANAMDRASTPAKAQGRPRIWFLSHRA